MFDCTSCTHTPHFHLSWFTHGILKRGYEIAPPWQTLYFLWPRGSEGRDLSPQSWSCGRVNPMGDCRGDWVCLVQSLLGFPLSRLLHFQEVRQCLDGCRTWVWESWPFWDFSRGWQEFRNQRSFLSWNSNCTCGFVSSSQQSYRFCCMYLATIIKTISI